MSRLHDERRALDVLQAFPHEAILAEFLFISTLSSFDAYLGHLLRNLYRRKPGLLQKLEAKAVPFGEFLNRSRNDIIHSMVDDELDALLRESYSKSLDKIAKRFDAGTLKKLKNWPKFIEYSQRRNVITHCDGHVNRQYLDVCESEGVVHGSPVAVNDKLTVSKDYLLSAIEVVTEVGLKTGQVLWRCASDSGAIVKSCG